MADPDLPPRALVVAVDRTPAPMAGLAARTLATIGSPEATLGSPQQLIVSADGSAMFTTIAAALEVAVEGDEISVRPGEYRESLVVRVSVAIRGDGPVQEILVLPSGELACIELRGREGTVSGISFSWPEWPEFSDGADIDPSLINIIGGEWTLDNLRVRDCVSDAIRASGTSKVTIRRMRVECAGTGVSVEDHSSLVMHDSQIEGFPTGVFINSIRFQRIQQCRLEAENALVVHDASSVVIKDSDLNGVVELHNVAVALVNSNRLYSPTIGLDVEGGGGRYWGNQIDSRGIGIRAIGGQAVFVSNQIDSDLTGIEIGANFSGRVLENDVWGPYPSAVISVLDSPNCRVTDNKRRHPEPQSELDVREFATGLGIRLSSTNQHGPVPLNIYDPALPLPQENLFSAPVSALGMVAAPLEEPSHDVGDLRAFDRVVAWGIVETEEDATEDGITLRFVVGSDARLRAERTDSPGDGSTRIWFYRT